MAIGSTACLLVGLPVQLVEVGNKIARIPKSVAKGVDEEVVLAPHKPEHVEVTNVEATSRSPE